MAVNPNAYASIANGGAGVVEVINSTTLATTDITLPADPVQTGTTITPDGTKLLVGLTTNDVKIIDTGTNTIIGTATLPHSINDCVSNNAFGYFTLTTGVIGIVNISTFAVTTLSPGGTTDRCCITPNGQLVYVSTIGGNSVLIIDTATNTFDAASPIATGAGSNPDPIMATANGSFIYVGDLNLSHIYKIATASQTIVTTIVTPGPLTTTVGFAVDATNGHVYFGDAGSGNVYVINISTNALTTIVSGTTPNRGVKVNDNPTFAYLQGATQAEDLLTNATPTSVTPISTTPRGAGFGAVSPNGQRLFVGDIGGGTVTVIDTSTNTVNSQIAHAGTSVVFVTAQYFPGGIPPTPTAISVPPLFIPHKVPQSPAEWDADWVTLETWSSWVGQLGKAPLFIPRKGSDLPMDLTTNWLAIENWANSL